MSHSDSEVDIDHAAMQDDDHLTALLPRIRILTIFAYWWEELEGSVYSDTARTIRCLHVISRIIEDATFASSSDINEIATALVTAENVTFDLENPLLKNLKEEFTVITDRLVKVVIEDFADVAYSVFQLSSNSSDVPFLKAVTRFLVAFKNACVKSGEDFYAIFLTMNLEGFIASFINYQDDIIAARIAYITGELIEDTNSDAPVEINSFINQSIKRYQTAFEQSALLINDIPKLIARLFHRTQYLMNSNIIVPLPQHANRSSVGGSNIANASTRAGGDNAENGATENEAGWFTDDCDDITGLEYHVSIAIGHLRLLGSVADYTETLPPVVESDFVSLCLRTLEFPLFDLQSVALSWFGSALAHKKIASEFIEKDGMRKLIAFMNPAQQEGKTRSQYYETKAQHVSFITVALAKHSQVMDTFIQDENVANELVAFGLQLLLGEQGEAKQGEGDIMVDTQLNIIEWFGDCFGHPYMLKAVNQTNLLSIIIQKIQASLLQDDDQSNKKMEKLTLLNHSLRREAVRSLLKYLVFNLYYAVQYTKKVESSQSHFVTSSNVGFSNLTRPSPGGRTRNVGGNTSEPWLYAQTNTSSSRHEFSWLNSINMMKLDEAALAQLELFVIQYIIDHGALPTGMKIDLFHAFDFNFTSNSVLLSGIAEDDAMSIASTVKKSSTEWIIAKQFLQSQVIPVMLKALLIESKDSSMFCLVLSILELLCLDYSMILEIQHCQVSSFFLPSNLSPHQAFPSTSSFGSLITNHAHISVVNQVSSANQMKKGIEILLGTISQESRKDPSIVTAALRVLAAMSTPPYFRYKGNNLNKAKSLLSEVLSHRKHLATNVGSSSNIIGTPNTSSLANPNSAFSKKSGGPLSAKKTPMGGSGVTAQILGRLEQIQKGVRTAIRSCSGITSLVQLIHYKKNQFYIISIRLETIKVLIGISHDAEIKLILSKMRIPMILEHQVKLFDGSNLGGAGHSDYYGDGHVVTPTAVVTKTIEKDLLFLYADSLIKLLTNTSSSSTGIDGVVVTDENLHASQELLDRKAIVDHSHIEFYESELMFLIKDHLLSKGMTQTVEMLEKESGEVDPSVAYSHSAGCGQFKAQSYNSIVNNAQLESRKRQYDTILEDTIQGHLLSQSLPPTQPSQEESNLLNPTDLASSVAIDSVKRARRSSSPFMTLPFSQSQAEGIHSAQLLTIDPLLQPSQEKEQFRILPPVPRSLRRKAIKKAFQSDERNLPASLLTEPINTFEQSYPPPTASGLSPIPLAHTISGAISFTEGGSGGAKLPITSPRVKSAQTATPIASFTINVNSSHKVPASAVKEIETSSKKIYAQYPAQVQSHQKHHHQQKHHHSNSSKGNNPVPSKLSSIMHRYLKLQHQQCKHPITTLPILSLQKPHACSKPSNLFTANKPSNIYSITSRRYAFSNTAWYNCYYRKHDFQQQLQYIYSNYRTIKSFRELESPSAMTATVFSKKMNQLYIAFNDYTMEEDPGIAMVDILTGQVSVSGHNDLHGTIMKLILSPNDYLMLTAVSPEEMDVHRLETVLEHELYLWRDPNDITVFDSPYLQRFRIKSENELMALTSSMYIPTEQFDRANYFHAEAFDPFHNNRLAALKINDFFHQSTGGIAHRTGTTTTTSTAATSATGGNNDEHQSSSYIFDIETGQIMESLYNDGNNDTYSIPKIHYHPHHPSLFFMDGKLWDLRINQIIHKFDKLSNNGNIAVHPYRSEVLIDHAVWDLRNFSLIQMIPLLENCLLHFHDYDSVLYAYHSILDNEVLLEKLFQLPSYSGTAASAFNSQNREQLLGKGGTNGFHVFHSGEYTHLHTEYIEKEYFQLMSLQTDPFQNGYMSSLLLNIHDVNDSIVRIYEIGKRKRLVGGGDSDGEDDDEDESDAEDEDWRNMSDEDDDEDDEDDDEDGDDDLDMDLEEVMSDDDDGEEEEEEDGEDDSENSDSNDDESYEGEEDSEEIEDENNFSLRREGSRRGGLNRSGTDENETISEESEDVRSGEVREMEQDDEEWETVSEDSDSEEDDTDNNSS